MSTHPQHEWVLTKEFRFEASHQLLHHDGKCARLHGHSWKGRVFVCGRSLHVDGPKQGMVIDYADIAAPIKNLVDGYLDHWHLNDSLGMESPTSENIARWLYVHLFNLIPGLIAVEIEETCTSSCRFGVNCHTRAASV